MADFPAKRRKTGDSSLTVPVDDATAASSPAVNNNNNQNSRPSISYRQSFQSPTRSSLARSNPEVLSHVLSRSPIKSPIRSPQRRESGFGLRDKKAIRPSLSAGGLEGAIGGGSAQKNALNLFTGISPRRGSGAIQAFAVPPRRISRAATTTGRPVVESSSSPAKTRQQAKDNVLTTPSKQHPDPDEQLASELDSATRELEHSGLLAPLPLPDDYEEPELPPTPTQLGLEQRPERGGRDLLSSPSAGRGRRKAPLGPSGLGEAVDLAVPERASEDRQVPEALKKKEAMKSELASQLDKLKADVAQLEKWALQAKQGTGASQFGQDAVTNLITLLSSNDTTYDPLSRLLAPETPPFSALISSLLPFSKKTILAKKDTTSSEPKNSFALEKTDESKRYLTIFAPLNLTYTSKLSVPSADSAVTEVHEITISAPAPFPQYLYSIPLTFTTELQSERILSISLMKKTASTSSTQSKIPPGLQAWIKSRLASPLLKLDISGLCVGVGQFWETSVCRARMWSALHEMSETLLAQGKKSSNTIINFSLLSSPITNKSTLRSLIPHLQRSSMLFTTHENPKQESQRRKILLSCPLALDHWTGEAQLTPDISIFAPDLVPGKRNRAERDMKQLFHNLLRAAAGASDLEKGRQMEAIVKATEGVIGLFFGLDSLARDE